MKRLALVTFLVVGCSSDSGSDGTDEGPQWAEMQSGVTADLNDIWGEGPDRIWAVGDDGVVIRFDGEKWMAEAFHPTRTRV